MKKYLFMTLLGLFILSACSNAADSSTETDSEELSNANEVKEEDSDKSNDGEVETSGQPDELDVEEEQEEQEEQESPEVEISPKYELTENWRVKPLEDGVDEQVVLLTIDDAPDEHALQMAETLNELDAGAIFFVNGHFLDTEEEKDTLRKIHEMGFLIGNHTFNHQALGEVDEQTQKEEIIKLNDLIEDIIGERPKFFRAPHGQNTDYSKKLAEEEGMLLMNWSYGYDWNEEYMTKEAIADIMVNTELLGNGANLLMHDREWTANALEDIVKGLRNKGFEPIDPKLLETPE
ncbi:polysaccharide deacetylase family protein [Sediminibacillus massiliensis]|uniref:polysaccharide deacetylase family protein n=1 Tax=Sediminibacillus massiliensis TaxID=1926277 RepID=UPI001FE5B432|nr:polysaccharide deacetylase family protein [Sediminibacillus massiliensis]